MMTKDRLLQPRRGAPIFIVGLLLLAASLLLWTAWLELFTEALLVPWYCCDLAARPPLGSWPRTFNDFFAAAPGRYLPLLLFFLAEGIIFANKVRAAANRAWLPMLFFLGNMLLFLASLVVVNLSWWVSNQLAGPRLGGIDAGYHRTWYGIVAHLSLWTFYFVALARCRLPRAWRRA